MKEFWEANKWSYLWSCLALTFLVLFMGVFRGGVKEGTMGILFVGILISFPLMLIMAFGIYKLTGGDKK